MIYNKNRNKNSKNWSKDFLKSGSKTNCNENVKNKLVENIDSDWLGLLGMGYLRFKSDPDQSHLTKVYLGELKWHA